MFKTFSRNQKEYITPLINNSYPGIESQEKLSGNGVENKKGLGEVKQKKILKILYRKEENIRHKYPNEK